LPGPTTIQVIVTIVTLKTRSLLAGVNCFIVYNAVPWVFLTILGLLSANFVQDNISNLPYTVKLFFMGFNAASAGIMVRNFISYMNENWMKWPKIFLTLVTAIIFYFNQSLASLLFCLALGAIVSLYQ
jgi:riboflavin transporter FmnP